MLCPASKHGPTKGFLPLYKAAPKNRTYVLHSMCAAALQSGAKEPDLCVAFHVCCRFTKRRQRTLLYVLHSMCAAALQSGAKEPDLCVAFHVCRFFFALRGRSPLDPKGSFAPYLARK
jgi:hypothetical protein